VEIASTPTEAVFADRRQHDWNELEEIVRTAETLGIKKLGATRIARLSPLYRDACADLAHARAARYAAPLVDYLQGLAASAHTILYGGSARDAGLGRAAPAAGAPLRVALELFPRAVRRHKVAMLVSLLLFFVPLLGGLAATLIDPTFAARMVPEGQLRPLAEAYRNGFDAGRGAGIDATMAGFYVHNNVGIALRCFATGLAFGLGSAFYLVHNGLATGAILGYVTAHGAGANILTFVVGHGSLELGAIGLAGGAGLSLGWSVVSPGPRTRIASLQATARSVVVVVLGAAVMLFMAAAVEGFWSASSAPVVVKRVVGGVMFVAVSAYIALGGRRSTEAEALERRIGGSR
jgi:uncharacterized membrane protein SpoIIM required for sporulation